MSDYWKEIDAIPTPAVSTSAAEFLVPTNKTLARRVRTSAVLLWFVAGLSAANLVLAYVGAPIRLIASLFSTEFLFAIGRAIGPVFAALALGLSIVVIGCTAGLGFFMDRYHRWAFITAMGLLAVDAAVIYRWTSLNGLSAFLLHGVAIYFLWLGFSAAKLYHVRKKNGQV